MPEPLLLLAVLIAAGAVVVWPLRGAPSAVGIDAEHDAAAVRHRVALEAMRDVEADRRAGSLDDQGYAEQLAEAEARAAMTAADLEAIAPAREIEPSRSRPRAGAVVAVTVGLALVAGSLLPGTGIANRTDVNEGLAAAEEAEAARGAAIAAALDELAADPQDASALSELADAYLAGSTGDDLFNAALTLQALISLEPDRADAYERLIGAYLRAGDTDNATRALASYEGRDTADPVEVAFFAGLVAAREGDSDSAIAAFDRFLELAPEDPRAAMVRGLREEADGG
jgi:cytochrome c-type biogenesis protein CcmH/NrfG